MSLRAAFITIGASLSTLAILTLVAMIAQARNLHHMHALDARQYEVYRLADHLHRTSNDLTRMAQSYVVTGDPAFEQWFERIVAIRDGKGPRPASYSPGYWDAVIASGSEPESSIEPIAIDALFRAAGVDDGELAMLSEVRRLSDTLAGTEAIAMAAVKGLFPAATGELTVEGEPDFDGAREIMYGPEYHAAKARIAALISDVFKLIEARTNEEIAAGRAYGRRLKAASFVFVVLSLVVLGVTAVILRRRVANPVRTLEEAARSVEAGEFPRLAPGRTSWDFPCAPLAGCPSLSKTTFSVESRASGSSALSKSSSARETGLLRFARAGHPLPVVARRGHAVTVSEDGGLPLGITDDAEFPDVVLQLEPGDRVYLYSDGCAEQLAASGRQQFGDERVGALLAGSEALTGAESIARLVRELALWAGADRFTDDVSLLVLEWGREEKTYGEAE